MGTNGLSGRVQRTRIHSERFRTDPARLVANPEPPTTPKKYIPPLLTLPVTEGKTSATSTVQDDNYDTQKDVGIPVLREFQSRHLGSSHEEKSQIKIRHGAEVTNLRDICSVQKGKIYGQGIMVHRINRELLDSNFHKLSTEG